MHAITSLAGAEIRDVLGSGLLGQSPPTLFQVGSASRHFRNRQLDWGFRQFYRFDIKPGRTRTATWCTANRAEQSSRLGHAIQACLRPIASANRNMCQKQNDRGSLARNSTQMVQQCSSQISMGKNLHRSSSSDSTADKSRCIAS